MPDNTAASRYLTSSDGINMQAQATQQIQQSADAGIQKINQSQSEYYKGVQQNSQNIGALQQQLAQIQVAGAQQPSSLSQLAEGVINGLSVRAQENTKTKAKALELAAAKQKTDAEKLKDTQLTQYGSAIGDLTDSYDSSNWQHGIEQYKTDASILLGNLPANVDPDVKRQLVTKVYENTQNRSIAVGAELAKQKQSVDDATASVAQSELLGNLVAINGNIANQSLDSQAKPFQDQARNLLLDFLKTDNGLPQAKKLSIIASAIDTTNAAYSSKYSKYTARAAQQQDFRKYAAEYSQIQALRDSGQLSPADFDAKVGALNFQYPGFDASVNKTGDEEKRTLALAQVSEAQRKLTQEAGARAIANTRFTDETVKAMVAGAYADPGFYNTLKNDPAYKDNPQFQQVLQGADRLQEFYNASNQLTVEQAGVAVQFAKLDFTNVQTITSLTRSLALKKLNQQQLSPTDQLAQQFIEQSAAANPALAATLELVNKKPDGKLTPEETASINSSLAQEASGIRNIQQQLVQEVQAKQNALYKKFPDLQSYGFLGQSQDAVRGYAKNVAPLVEQERQRLERQRLEAQQAVQQPQYGVQPNFNQSSNYGTSLDDNGKVRVVPRHSVHLLRLSDGTSVVTPVIAGTDAPVTGGYGDGRQRPNPHRHAGVDFAAPSGGKLVSLVSGTIVVADHGTIDPGGYGDFVDVLGDNGFLYRYGHTSATVKVGQRIGAGDVVGTANKSGDATGAHLHFEVHPNPKFTNGKYDVHKNFGFDETADVYNHLRSLTANASNVTSPRYNAAAYRTAPNNKVPSNSLLTSGGGAINGGTYQRLGGQPGGVTNRITSQRPATMSKAPYKVNVGSTTINYDYGDNFGYAELQKNTGLRTAFVDTAKKLGVPPVWLVDIARQEAGSFNPQTDHHNGGYGLFGFGADSFNSDSEFQQLKSGQLGGAAQLKQYAQYLKDNGWDKIVKKKGGAVTIADLWAFSRMGWNMRQKFWNSGDTKVKTNGGLTYQDELNLLGKWAGRSYSLPGSRSQRNAAVSTGLSSYCSICQQMQASNTYAPHTHTG